MNARRWTAWTWVVVWSAACTSSGSTASEPPRGGRSESCTARADCESGLACFDNRCEPADQLDTTDSDAGAVMLDTRGGVGESCTRRADCNSGLGCVANVCVEDPATVAQSVLGQRGESCLARNDCVSGLSCVDQRCVVDELPISVQPKQCVRIECESDDDCCAKFVVLPQCPMWKEACAMGDTASCSSFNSSCVCNLACRADACVPAHKCSSDTDCGAGYHCYDGTCAQCGADSDCTVSSQHCIAGVCQPGCEHDEQCAMFSECQDGECVDVGCRSDRACYFATKDPFSQCNDGRCVSTCTSSTQCPPMFACEADACVFVGCESDAECRVYLNLNNQPAQVQARCRAPDR